MLYTLANDLGHPRLGITASRKVGPAVARNLAKRRVRDIFRRFPGRPALAGVDLVVHLQPGAGKAPFSELSAQLLDLLSALSREGVQGGASR
jgi:ribonuclease P protein component